MANVMMSTTQLDRLVQGKANDDRKIKKLADALKSKVEVNKGVTLAVGLGAAGVAGFARGKLEKSDGSWTIGNTPVDIELLAFGGLVAAAFAGRYAGLKPKHEEMATIAALGVGSHYVGQVARNLAKGAKLGFPLVAGGGYEVGRLPQYEPEYVGAGLRSALEASGV